MLQVVSAALRRIPIGAFLGAVKTITCPGSGSFPSRLHLPAAWAIESKPARAL